MSRAAVSRSQHIFITEVTQADGSKTPVITAYPLCDQSARVNRAWNGSKWIGNQYIDGKCSNSGALFLLITLCSRDDIPHKKLTYTFWWNILHMVFSPDSILQIGTYATAIRRPKLFPMIDQKRWKSSFVIVDAVMRGQEDMVVNILFSDPSYLLKKAKVKNSVGVEHEFTPLQAAIAAFDLAPNENSTGLTEIIFEHLKRAHQEDYQTIFEAQARELYEKSLTAYVTIFKTKIEELGKTIASLCKKGGELALNDPKQKEIVKQIEEAKKKLHEFQTTLLECKAVLASKDKDLNTLIKTHENAQKTNAFDFKPYVDAILAIDLNDPQQKAQLDDVMALINAKTPEETAAVIARTGVGSKESDDCRDKPFDQLTLVQKLNRFREQFILHMRQEPIYNPNHILAALEANDKVWDTLSDNQDPNYEKRSIIFSQLCGFAQRMAAEPVKQDIRQGTWYLTQENERRTRQSRFNGLDRQYNVVKNAVDDVSLGAATVVDGLGYKFARRADTWRAVWLAGAVALIRFQNLCRTKTAGLQNLLRRESNRLTVA